MGAYDKLFASILSSRRSQHEVKHVVRIHSQAADFCRRRLQRSRDAAGFVAIAVEAQGADICRREIDGVPFKDDGGLCGISAAENRWGRGPLAVSC